MGEFDWSGIRLAVFDLDGTLYDQRRLRLRMMATLAGHCLLRPWDLRVLRIISQFRRSREALAEEESEGISDLQYKRPARQLGVHPDQVRRVVEYWMLDRPLEYLHSCRFADAGRLMQALRTAGVAVAVLSDYPAADKLAALELEADILVSAVDPRVDRLKPHPRGLQRVIELAGVEPEKTVMIGDRDERDGECARRAGARWLIKAASDRSQGFFKDYSTLLESFERSAAEEAALQ